MNTLQDCRQTKGQTHANQPVTTLSISIDLFTDTAAILNSLDLQSHQVKRTPQDSINELII